MIKLRNIISQLEEDVFVTLSNQLNENKADKFLQLLKFYRENKLSDENIMKELDVKVNAFYTLKSRLFDKLQETLTSNLKTEIIDLLRQVSAIPDILYGYSPDLALAILTKLEKDLIQYDLPHELTKVYSALKKLSVNTAKYYEYSQLQNRAVAYSLTIDKVEDFTSTLAQKAGEYYLSKNEQTYSEMLFIKKEIENYCRLYSSHRLQIYAKISELNCYLCGADYKIQNPELFFESAFKIFEEHHFDKNYQYLKTAFHFLAFEYYMAENQVERAKYHFYNLKKNISTFLNFKHSIFSTRYLNTLLEWSKQNDEEGELINASLILEASFDPEPSSPIDYILYKKFQAITLYYQGKPELSKSILHKLTNEVSFKNFPHAEIEIKLMLVYFILITKPDPITESILRSVYRKIKEREHEINYENASTFSKILKFKKNDNFEDRYIKLKELGERFEKENVGKSKMLSCMKINSQFFNQLLKHQ